jgi:hypothetical protein
VLRLEPRSPGILEALSKDRMVALFLSFLFLCFFLMAGPLYALTAEEVIRLKEAGVDEKTIQMLIEGDPAGSLGVKEIERPEGGRDKIYYSITRPEEETSRAEEKEKMENSWEMLKNILIEERRK